MIESILELLNGKSTEIRWYVLARILNSNPNQYSLSESSLKEANEILGIIKTLLLSDIESSN